MIDRVAFWIFVLILASLVLRNWKGANALLGTSFTGGNNVIKTLENFQN